MNHPVISRYEIPVEDFERARRFYSTIFSIHISDQNEGGLRMGFFSSDKQDTCQTGAIVLGPRYVPSHRGVLAYFYCGKDLQTVLDRVEIAGGSIVSNKLLLEDDGGYVAHIVDSEGNLIALHSSQ